MLSLSVITARLLAVVCALAPLTAPIHAQSSVHRPAARPGLNFAYVYGGTGTEQNPVVAIGLRSSIFLTGTTTSLNWPIAWKSGCGVQACPHAFLLKLQPDGTQAFYSVALGGSRSTTVSAIAVDRAGNAYLTGTTTSSDFRTVRALQPRCAGVSLAACSDGFVTEINPKGSVVFSTYLGGSLADTPTAIALDAHDDVYVAGYTVSPDFPTVHAAQSRIRGRTDGFVAKLTPDGRRILFSTYLGGAQGDMITSIAADGAGDAYVAGSTASPNFPVSRVAMQPHFIGGKSCFSPCDDAFVTALHTDGRFLAGTFLATPSDDHANALALDHRGNVYVAGDTGNRLIPSTAALPPTNKPLCGSEGVVATCASAFVTELAPRLNRSLYTRMLSGDGVDTASTIAVNWTGNVVVGGYTESTNFPTVNPVQAATGGGDCVEVKGAGVPCDGFVAIVSPGNRSLRFSTYLGGDRQDSVQSLVLDGHGNAYLAGTTTSLNFAGNSPAGSVPKVFLARIEQLYR